MQRHGQLYVEVMVRGAEVAKWAMNKRPVPAGRFDNWTIADKLGVVSMHTGVVKDLPIEDWPDELQPSDVPYLDPQTAVTFVLLRSAFDSLDADDFAALGQRALAVVQEETGLIATAAAFELRVEER